MIVSAIAIILLFNVVMSDRNETYYAFRQLRPNTINEENCLCVVSHHESVDYLVGFIYLPGILWYVTCI